MGKRYRSELDALPKTIEWACAFDTGLLRAAIENARHLPVVAIGSGGSLSVAHHLALLHSRFTGRVSAVHTPLEIASERLHRSVSGWVISASGNNQDILKAFAALVANEPCHLGVLCGSPDSPLARAAKDHQFTDTVLAQLPSGKDGFLATNSLLGFAILLARAYVEEFGNKAQRTALVRALHQMLDVELSRLQHSTTSLWARDTLVVLHGFSTKLGAIDIESKFTEAALGNVQIADYRNFAHGRHHWLAKHALQSAVFAFITPTDRELAEKTLHLIPKTVPVVRAHCNGGEVVEGLQAVRLAIHMADWVGQVRGIDPGRPGVPKFGARIYHLRYKDRKTQTLPVTERVPIERKAGESITSLEAAGRLGFWRDALKAFRRTLGVAPIRGVVFDYDGTLVDTRVRTKGLSQEVADELVRLIRSGLRIGIATGRGKSVRKELQQAIPKKYWKNLLVGYYNGAEIGPLQDDTRPDGTDVLCNQLRNLGQALTANPQVATAAKITCRRWQITLEPKCKLAENHLWDLVNEVFQQFETAARIVRSSHSVDVLVPGITKERVVERLAHETNIRPADVLRIGDRGRWPGNDFDLLRSPLALSVDEVSCDPLTCWNLAPQAQRGIQAALTYCKGIRVRGGIGRVSVEKLTLT